MPLACHNAAQRRYNLRIGAATGLYIVFLAIEVRYLNAVSTPALRYALAALPALPVMSFFVIMARYLAEEQDEYIRARTVEQALGATGLTLAGATLWGFLEEAGLPHVPMYFAAVAWFGALGLIACFQAAVRR